MTRTEVIKHIRANLRARSGRSWSVFGGKGTGYGWITIRALGRDAGPQGYLTEPDQKLLAELLGLDRPVHKQGVRIPSDSNYYREYLDRAAGIKPTVFGTPSWD